MDNDILEYRMSDIIADAQAMQVIVNEFRYEGVDIYNSHLIYIIRVLAEHCEGIAEDVIDMIVEDRKAERIKANKAEKSEDI